MKVLILGNGAREHALAWKLSQSPACEALFLHPGNAATRRLGFRDFGETLIEPDALITKARSEFINLIVIGPEALLAEGYVNEFRNAGFTVFGPDRASARLETSKAYAKHLMHRAQIPTAAFVIAENEKDYATRVAELSFPRVLKLDGLASGKGVVVAQSLDEASDFQRRIWSQHEFGKKPHRVVIEEFIAGTELSYIGLCDGKRFIPLATAQDYKQLLDKGQGPNTGGMGAVSPSPVLTKELEEKIQTRIVKPLLLQFDREGIPYTGALFLGIMVTPQGDPFVLEFNCRLGDPETQAVLPRLKSDLLPALLSTAQRQLEKLPPFQWDERACVYVVAAAEGYPGTPSPGDPIEGIDNIPRDCFTFFGGVAEQANHLVTGGGRVLGVGALAEDRAEAKQKVYAALESVRFRGMQYRRDIG